MPRVIAVVVAYREPGLLASLLQSLSAQTRPPDDVIVVDNGGDAETRKLFDPPRPGVEYVPLRENAGSAGGYHEGVKRALADADYVLTLDDDVAPEPGCVAALLEGFERLSASRKVGAVRAVGPRHEDREPTPLDVAPWRGTLFSAAAAREAGPPDPTFFIYGEDLEYSLRLRRLGYEFFWIPGAVCPERRQGKTDDVFLGRPARIYPSAFRLYYALRNELLVYRAYAMRGAALRVLLYAVKVGVYLVAREGSRAGPKLRAVAAGVADGLRGRRGKNPDYLPAA